MDYELILPFVPFLGGYFVTYILYKVDIIRKAQHVALWNAVLFLAFLVSGGAGFLLMVLMEMGVITPINYTLMYWHVELGITLVLVTIFHLHIYWKSTKRMFTGKKSRKKEAGF
ncbi:hypothetical protein [Methanobacterium alcaliphilum]|uniref:hypothetical protein n=1 Tax=Methanobacterium alcaliphilum TaxID=392018 RepID=UPI002009EDFB|nr:hypothetical protein [Methanobacterium alcaliphilum]MCK9151144.1 hypothetical protein [Methanobacterium alcaliphilum]